MCANSGATRRFAPLRGGRDEIAFYRRLAVGYAPVSDSGRFKGELQDDLRQRMAHGVRASRLLARRDGEVIGEAPEREAPNSNAARVRIRREI